jgi:excisionase family DNA binding protein
MDKEILEEIKGLKLLIEQNNLLQKEILNFDEGCAYLDISKSHLYKLTSSRQIPHYCPQGKRLYFVRSELDLWLQRNPVKENHSIEKEASDYLIRKGRID